MYYYIQYKFKGMYEAHNTLSKVEAFWIENEELVIKNYVKIKEEMINLRLPLSALEYVNFDEEITEEEVKELKLRNKIVDLKDDLTVLSFKHLITRDQWQGKDDEMYNYHQGYKNAVDLCIVKLNEVLGVYKRIEEGGK